MGVFTMSNGLLDKDSINKIYQSRGHKKVLSFQKNKIDVIYSNKILFDNDNFYEEGDAYILGIGTYFYKSHHGYEALKFLLEDFSEELIIYQNSIYGHYAFIVCKGDTTYVFTDMSGTLRLYTAQEDDKIVVSSSYLAAVSSLKKKEIDSLRLEAFIGSSIASEIPFVEGIELFHPRKLLRIKDGKPTYVERPVDEVPRIDNLEEAISYVNSLFDEQVHQLKGIGEEKISLEITAGLDSRLLASVMKKNQFNFQFVNYPLFGLDMEVGSKIATELGKEIDTIKNEPNACTDKNGFGEFDLGFDLFRHYPNKRWNAPNRFQFSGLRGECIAIPDFCSDSIAQGTSMANGTLTSILKSTLGNDLVNIDKYKYIKYLIEYLKSFGFEDKVLSEKEITDLTQVAYGFLTDYIYISGANACLNFYSIYNEWHFIHYVSDIAFNVKENRRLTIALIKSNDKQLSAMPFVSHTRISKPSVDCVDELQVITKSHSWLKKYLPTFVINKLYSFRGTKNDSRALSDIDVHLFDKYISVKRIKKYPCLLSKPLDRLRSVNMIGRILNIQ